MRAVIVGWSKLVELLQQHSSNGKFDQNFEILCAVDPFNTNHEYPVPVVTRSQALNLYHRKKIDAYVFALGFLNERPEIKKFIRELKMHGVKNIFVYNVLSEDGAFLFRHDTSKYFLPYLETNLVDGCNLNCKACTHFSNLFERDEIYNLDEFYRDIKQLSETVDIVQIRLMGGEPLLLKNIDEYIDTARLFFPRAELTIVTNGLLIPTADPRFFEAVRRNSAEIHISQYPPTIKMINQIKERLNRENVHYGFGELVENFKVTFSRDFQPVDVKKSLEVCHSPICRFLHHGKIYKCPTDGLLYRFNEKFGIHGLPIPTEADIYSKDLPSMLDRLDDVIGLCQFCVDKTTTIPWQISRDPQIFDWMA